MSKNLKLPNTIIIAGTTWKVIKDKNMRGGSFDGNLKLIKVGLKNKNKEEQLSIFLHEVLEAIFSERLLRYSLPYEFQENGHLIFCFNHDQFEQSVIDFGLAIKGITNI